LANRESAELSRKLAQIEVHAPVEFKIDKCTLPKLDRLEVEILFDRLEFRSLIPRLRSGKTRIKNQEVSIKNQEINNKKNEGQISLF